MHYRSVKEIKGYIEKNLKIKELGEIKRKEQEEKELVSLIFTYF